jgi:hypothetical protein
MPRNAMSTSSGAIQYVHGFAVARNIKSMTANLPAAAALACSGLATRG